MTADLDGHVRWRAVELDTDAGRTVIPAWYTLRDGVVRGARRCGDLTVTVLAHESEVRAVYRTRRPTPFGRLVVDYPYHGQVCGERNSAGAVCRRPIGHHARHAYREEAR